MLRGLAAIFCRMCYRVLSDFIPHIAVFYSFHLGVHLQYIVLHSYASLSVILSSPGHLLASQCGCTLSR